MKPTYLGIGAQKCASTWLHYILQDHPQVTTSKPKELNFFSCHYDKGIYWYENHFAANPGKRAVGEISPSYFYDLSAPLRAYKYNPDFRIIVTLRDPVERMYSNHLHEIRLGHFQSTDLSFEAGLANNPMYLEQSRYATHISRWLNLFPREKMLVLLQEEIHLHPAEQARRVYGFLGIDQTHHSEFLDRRANESRQPRNSSIDQLFKGIGTLGRRIGMDTVIDAVKRSRPVSALRNANMVQLRQFVPPLDPGTRSRLEAELADEVIELATLLGRTSLPWPTWDSYSKTRSFIHSTKTVTGVLQ